MSSLPLFDAAGRRRSPATMPGYHAGREPATKAERIPPIRRPSRRSLQSCAKPARIDTACASAR